MADNVETLSTVGYRVHEGGPTESPELQGKYWWTRLRAGWSEPEASPGEFNTVAEAWLNAGRAFVEELKEAAKGFTVYEGNRPLDGTSVDDIPAAEQAAFWESLGMNSNMCTLDTDILYHAWARKQAAITIQASEALQISHRDVLNSFPQNKRVSDLYDDYPALGDALNNLIPDFEYPDYSHRTVGEIVRTLEEQSMQDKDDLTAIVELLESAGFSKSHASAPHDDQTVFLLSNDSGNSLQFNYAPNGLPGLSAWKFCAYAMVAGELQALPMGGAVDAEGVKKMVEQFQAQAKAHYQGWTNSATFLAAQYIQQEPSLNDVIAGALKNGIGADGPGFETLLTQVCGVKVLRNENEDQDESKGCGLVGKTIRLDSWAEGEVNYGEIGKDWASELQVGKPKDTRIFVVEVPHQRPPSAWVAADREDFVDCVNRAGRWNGPKNDFDACVAHVEEDLNRAYIFEGGEVAAKGLSEITGHQSGHAYVALREKLRSYGVFEEVQDKVLGAASALGITVNADKVQDVIESREGPKSGVMIGKVLAVDDDLGLVFQSIGQGKGVVLPAETLSRPVVVGNVEVISYVDGKGTVSDRTVRQERDTGR